MNIIYIQDQEIDHYNGHFYHSKSEHFFSRFLAGLKENDTLTVYAGIITRKSAHEVEKYKDVTNSRITYKQIPEFRNPKNLLVIKRILEQILQIADSALILILFAFCRMVLKIFTQIAVGTRFLDRLNQFRSLLKFSLINLLLNFLYVVLCQFLSHFPPDPYLFSSSRLFIASLMHPMIP